MSHMRQLFHPGDLAHALTENHVRVQTHPTEDLRIFNYTETAMYDGIWNDVTRQCRGLIVNGAGQVIARPWPKYYNYGQAEAGELDLDAPADVTDKMDGSLGILYPTGAGWAIATRGSFTSDQALHATARLQQYLRQGFAPLYGWTYLFEIVYPQNRIVLDYGDRDELVLLGAVNIATGRTEGPGWTIPVGDWPGPRAEVFPARTLREALELEPRPNAEGLVVRYPTGQMVKIKQDDYVALHAVLTGMNARKVWEFLAVEDCKALIAKPVHWGSYLKIDPADAARILSAGDNWMAALLHNVPDEFHTWLTETVHGIREAVAGLQESWARDAHDVVTAHQDRRARWDALADNPDRGEIIAFIDGRDVTTRAWMACRPEADRPWGARGEDVA